MSQVMKASRFGEQALAAGAREAAPAARVAWIDVAKGIGIVLVVAGHAIGGLIDAGIRPETDWFRPLMLAMYLFHMPLFFFLSGLFLPDRLEGGRAGVAKRALGALAWPYLLWGGTQVVVIHAAGTLVNAPVEDLPAALTGMLFVSPPSQFWFLYVLLMLQLLAVVLLPLIGAAGLVGVAVVVFLGAPEGMPVVPALAAKMLLYFALGCAVGARGRIAALAGLGDRQVAGIVLFAIVACGTTMAALVAMTGPETFATLRAGGIAALAWHPLSAVAAVAGTVAVAAASARLRGSLGAAFAYLGRRSMAIYILHVMALAGTRIVMTKLFGIATPALLPLLVFVGVAVPLAASAVARRLGLARALAL